MKDKVAIIILGKRNAGKSSTFYELFGRKIRTGWKILRFDSKGVALFIKNSSFEEMGENINDNVFVRNSSFEECGDDVEHYFDESHLPKVVLCAVQYKEKGIKTIEYFKDNGYYLYIQWLNPGHNNNLEYEDYLNFETTFSKHGEFHKVSGKEKKNRVHKIEIFLKNYLLNKHVIVPLSTQ